MLLLHTSRYLANLRVALRSVTDGFYRSNIVTQCSATVRELVVRRPELSDLVGSCAADPDFQELCSDTIFLLDRISAVKSQRAKLGLLHLLHELNAEIDEFLILAGCSKT